MNKKKMNEIIENLRHDNTTLYTEGAFNYFMDNQISEEELAEILKEDNYILPESFYSLSRGQKKLYFNHTKLMIGFDVTEPTYDYFEIFNKNYFYDLAMHAKTNKELTRKLIDYVFAFSQYDGGINTIFLGMQYVKLDKTNLLRFDSLKNYAQAHEITDLYSLLISLFSDKNSIEGIKEMRELIVNRINRDDLFECDLNEPFYKFCLLLECILNTLTDKEANTLKVVFGILDETHLRDIDYYQDRLHQNRLVNTFKKNTKDSNLLNRIDIFVSDNQETYDNFQPNGYKALYQYLLGEKIE
ncbi:MAG: hypothetical protein ACI311_07000 [Bacilli bacterium]